MDHEAILVLDFGGQYNQLIARRVREQSVYCEVHPYREDLKALLDKGFRGVILTGGPRSVNAPDAPSVDPRLFTAGIPVLGICYGAQLMAKTLGGTVSRPTKREYGEVKTSFDTTSPLFSGLKTNDVVWMSHTDQIETLPEGFRVTAHSDHCPVAAMDDPKRRLYGLQFHPEVTHTRQGDVMLAHFLFEVCRLKGDWKLSSFIDDEVQRLRDVIGDRSVVSGLSGGLDSSVASLLVHRAVGDRLTCLFVDHGMHRKGEADDVERLFRKRFGDRFVRVNAQERFLRQLDGVTDAEEKRKRIGELYIRVFEEEADKLGHPDLLVQGTIYPDVIESGVGDAAVIKSHHNVGGLPKDMRFQGIVEPLRHLFKDEVRRVGLELGLPESLVRRQPFPGPGLAIRIMGPITEARLACLRDADAIVCEEMERASLHRDVNQYFAVLTNVRSVGVMGDERTYDETVAIRAVTTSDFMTADWAKLPYELLGRMSSRIVNEVNGVNRVVYDITSKPPATIEWE